ncbi:uncharacterized protein LOC128178869 [Crassostrea angulata]|uniref:uncharacterized protein LOC128178869 n=1 Tax=Magallana angulata TaxID=2784310 RepID=UPI0022B16683|nr:uncharacterized protein LOC128178869 [Crassostrea angulata]
MEKLFYFGDDDLGQAMERMDQLSELKLKLTAAQYLEDLREEVIVENLYRTEEETERQQELKTEKSRRIIQRIQAEILKKILPVNRSSQMAVRSMKTIKENHVKIATVQMELLKKLRQHDANNFFEESNGELEVKNQFDPIAKNSSERDEARELKLVTADKNAQLINKIQVDLLRTILPMDRSARMAVKYMKIIRESRTKLLTIQDEVLKKLKEREDDYMAESLKKLEKVNQTKWKTTLDAWDKDKRNQIVFFILVDQVRRLRSRCPQMSGKIMKKIQNRQLILQKLHGELVKRVNERETVHQTRETVHKELMTEIKRREEMKERQKSLQMEIMRAVDDSHFIPRKLFLNGVETFKSVPKPNVTARVGNREKKEATISQCNGAKSESKLKSGTKPTLKNRLKRLFGFH